MTKRILVGGPSNSGKSSYVLSLVAHAKKLGRTAEAFEFDVWSNSYPAFFGEVAFEDRPKRFDLGWDWRAALDERLDAFNASACDLVFGDMPGVLGAAVVRMCERAIGSVALVISHSLEGVQAWQRLFRDDFAIDVLGTYVSVKRHPPIGALPDLGRRIVPDHPAVADVYARLMSKQP
jgi:hypothetical protein